VTHRAASRGRGELRAAYDKWWDENGAAAGERGRRRAEDESVQEIYWKQFNEQPDETSLRQMDPRI